MPANFIDYASDNIGDRLSYRVQGGFVKVLRLKKKKKKGN